MGWDLENLLTDRTRTGEIQAPRFILADTELFHGNCDGNITGGEDSQDPVVAPSTLEGEEACRVVGP